jgi:hypothetical protein
MGAAAQEYAAQRKRSLNSLRQRNSFFQWKAVIKREIEAQNANVPLA